MSSQAGKIFEKVVVLPKSRSSLLKIHEIVVLAYIIVHFMSCPEDFQKVTELATSIWFDVRCI